MATLTLNITVPDAIQADFVATLAAQATETLRPGDSDPAGQATWDGLTNPQKARRYVAYLLRQIYLARKRAAAETTASASVAAAQAQAESDSAGVS